MVLCYKNLSIQGLASVQSQFFVLSPLGDILLFVEIVTVRLPFFKNAEKDKTPNLGGTL